jgi:hypothetical protein
MNLKALFDMRTEAGSVVNQIVRFDIPEGAPKDLQDRKPLFLLARDGRRVWAHITARDPLRGTQAPAASLLWAGLLVMLAVASPTWFASIPVFVVMGAVLVFLGRRGQVASAAASFREASAMSPLIAAALAARHAQGKSAKPIDIEIGRSTGQLAERADIFGADAGQVMGLSVDDLSTHLWCFGPTGSGKTSGLLRPLLNQWLAGKKGGALVMDGKGDLPTEFAGEPGFQLLAPDIEGCRVALLGDLEPSVIVSVLSPPDDAEFWTAAGKNFLYNILVCIKAVGRPYTILEAADAAMMKERREAILLELARYTLSDVAQDAANALGAHDKMPEKTRGGIEATVSAWLRPLLSDPFLFDWASCAPGDGVDVTACMRGESLGVNVPEYRFGAAAVPVSRLVAAQVYRYAKNRGSHWPEGDTACLSLIDEAALVVSAQELQILPVARSLGMYFVCACQSKDQVEDTFNEAGAGSLLDCFRSLVFFSGGSEKTREYMAQRAGDGVIVEHTPEISFHPVSATRVDGGGGEGGWIMGLGAVKGLVTSLLAQDTTAVGNIMVASAIPEGLTLQPGEAVALLNRGGVIRRDSMQTKRVFGKPMEIKRRALPPLAVALPTPEPIAMSETTETAESIEDEAGADALAFLK